MQITGYDESHFVTCPRLLDSVAAGADWRDISRIVLGIDPTHELQRARRAFDTHLARAKWMTVTGYKLLLQDS